MKLTKFILVGIILCFTLYIKAQVQGKIVDKNGEPLIGVSVMVKDSDNGTITDENGTYSINANSGILICKYLGFKDQEIEINGRKVIDFTLEDDNAIDFTLEDDNIQLENVVVIGYGTQKKKDLTSAIVTIDDKAIRNRPLASAAEALQGKAAGVQVIQPSGKPGGDVVVRVRGATSVLAGNEPLYVVDGLPTTDIRGINPNDVENISVLKDASSSSIYGARAANGVVLITTKKGKANQQNISLNVYSGITKLRKTIDVLNTRRYRELIDEISPGSLDPLWTSETDWGNEVFGLGKNQSYQLAVSGGTDKSRYMVSGNYLKQDGIVQPASFNRFSTRINLDNELNKWLTFGTNINLLYSKTKDTQDNASSGRGGVIMSALNTPPFLNIYNKDGSGQFDPNPFQPSWENPIAYIRGPEQFQNDSRILGNVFLSIKPIKSITFKSSFGADLNSHAWDYYLDPFRTNNGRNSNGIGIADKSTTTAWLNENTLTYVKNIGESEVNFLVGNSVQKSKWSDSFLQGNDFPDDTSVKTLNAANTITGNTRREEWAIASFFSRATYNFKSRYIVTGSLRRDGSSKLANHWGTFPSASVAWRISDEPFVKKIAAIYDLKLRMGWGINGNQEGIPNYARFGLINYNRSAQTFPLSGPSSTQVTYGNPDLKWETTQQSNVGFDLQLLSGRVTITTDAYLKKTKDVLLNVQLSNSLPINSIQTNAGKIDNKGIDFSISSVNLTKSAVRWNTDFNISFNKNVVQDLTYTDVYYFGRIYSNNQDVSILKKGLALGTFYGYISDGVDPETGDIKYRDLNGNGSFDPGDRTIIGNAQPDFTYGLTNDISYKNFDLNILIQGSYGNDIFNGTRIDLEGMFDSKNQSVAVLKRWTPTNKNTDIPRAIGGGNVKNVYNSSRFVEDGSYARIKALTLGYNFKLKALDKANIKNFKVYATAQNLFTLTKYSGFDPEVNAFGGSATEVGIDYGTYPQSMSITLGANVDF